MTNHNYWQNVHMQRTGEGRGTSDAARFERACIERANAEPDRVCGNCGGTAQFRMTVGRHQCPACGAVDCITEWRVPGARAQQAEADTCAECGGTGSIAGASHGGMVEQLACSSCDTEPTD